MTSLSIPPAFTLAHYRLHLEALDELHLPPFKGTALRGGFGHHCKRLACMQASLCDRRCERGNACAYGYIFETSLPEGSEVLRTFSEVPRPFVIQSPEDMRRLLLPGEQLTFGLTLVGQGINQLPYFVVVFRELGRIGLGKTRGKYRLLRLETRSLDNDAMTSIYRIKDKTIYPDDLTIDSDLICTHVATLPTDHLTLNFRTPTKLKHRGRWIRQGPPFQALIKVLISRVSSLSYFHCGQRFETDFRGLIDRAAAIHIAESDTCWQDWSRFSGRQKQRIDMGGLIGQVTYEGDLGNYLPLLVLGQFIHVGKGNVFGNGQYQIVSSS